MSYSKPLWRDILLLLVISYAAFWFHLGRLGLIDPDEPFYAQTAREMVHSGDWLTPQIFGAPQFEKPILYYWMVAGSFRTFGESEFSGRLPTAVFATLLALLTYLIGYRVVNRRAGLIAGLFMASGLEVCVMGRLMLTDIPLAFFITASLYCYWLALHEPERRNRWIFAHMVCGALAVLTKGPIGSIAPLLCTVSFSLLTRQPLLLRGRGFWLGVAAYAAIVLPWYSLMLIDFRWQFVNEFFIRDNWLRLIRAEHPANNHFFYYPAILFGGSLPWLPSLVLAIRRFVDGARTDRNQLFFACWFVANLLFLTVAQSKLPSYCFYLFVPLALLIGSATDSLIANGFRSPGEKWLVKGAAVLQGAVVVAALFMQAARAFYIPILAFSALLIAALVLLLGRRYRLWLASTVMASAALLAVTLTCGTDKLEAMCSSRPMAKRMLEVRQGNEPLLAGKFAIRGIYYYTGLPVTVLSNRTHPFWADHPLPIIAGKEALVEFLEQHSSALCTMREGDWNVFRAAPGFQDQDGMQWIGDNLIVRAHNPQGEKPLKKAAAVQMRKVSLLDQFPGYSAATFFITKLALIPPNPKALFIA